MLSLTETDRKRLRQSLRLAWGSWLRGDGGGQREGYIYKYATLTCVAHSLHFRMMAPHLQSPLLMERNSWIQWTTSEQCCRCADLILRYQFVPRKVNWRGVRGEVVDDALTIEIVLALYTPRNFAIVQLLLVSMNATTIIPTIPVLLSRHHIYCHASSTATVIFNWHYLTHNAIFPAHS